MTIDQHEAIASWPPTEPIAAELGRRLRLAARRLVETVVRQGMTPPLLDALWRALRVRGKLLGSRAATGHPVTAEDRLLWSLLVVLAHAGAAGADAAGAPMASWRAVAPVAAAAEFLGIGCDLIDDIQDGDGALVAELGVPLAVQLAATLLELARAAIGDAHTPEKLRSALHDLVTTALLTAASGQYLDILHEGRASISMDEAMSVTERKSGTLIGLLLEMGALTGASGNPDRQRQATDIASKFGKLGRHLGVMMQLANDAGDVSATTSKSDRERGKKTPILVMEAELARSGSLIEGDAPSAAQQFIQVMMAVNRSQARETMARLATDYGVRADWLDWLLPTRRGSL